MSVIITPEEFPSYVTVLHHNDRYCATVVRWNYTDERYEVIWMGSERRRTKSAACNDASKLSMSLHLTIRQSPYDD